MKPINRTILEAHPEYAGARALCKAAGMWSPPVHRVAALPVPSEQREGVVVHRQRQARGLCGVTVYFVLDAAERVDAGMCTACEKRYAALVADSAVAA